MRNIQLVSLWRATRRQNTYINYHTHNCHELVYYLSGSGNTNIAGTPFHFVDNTFTLIPKNTEHDELHYADSEVICLKFSGADDLQLRFYQDGTHRISKILTELLYEISQQSYGYQNMLEKKLNEIMLHIARKENDTGDAKNFDYIINLLRENFHEHIILSDCAKQLNISYDYFQHKFKSLTGTSPQQFLIEQRLLYAEKLLAEGSFNCTEIAYRCGFSTSAQFSAFFKRRFGQAPLQFKKQQLQFKKQQLQKA